MSKKLTPAESVEQVIANCEANMPKCYNEVFYRIHLANAISDTHIAKLKERKRQEREDRIVIPIETSSLASKNQFVKKTFNALTVFVEDLRTLICNCK